MDPEVYDRLHKELIAVCQALAAEAGGTKACLPTEMRRKQMPDREGARTSAG